MGGDTLGRGCVMALMVSGVYKKMVEAIIGGVLIDANMSLSPGELLGEQLFVAAHLGLLGRREFIQQAKQLQARSPLGAAYLEWLILRYRLGHIPIPKPISAEFQFID